ncbi:uncharacterized protein METZ01_LOCUS257626 [marine metagenome]|uniref:Uncharacterized protein n=1 Tax=marine metagenome TaxID=408172 RepID=A0A382J019_9ZZZZ
MRPLPQHLPNLPQHLQFLQHHLPNLKVLQQFIGQVATIFCGE